MRSLAMFLTISICVLALVPSYAFDGDFIKIEGTEREKISESQLLRRYPVGKHWKSSKVLRVRGISKNKDWGLEGEQHVVYTNRYQSSLQILENELGDIRLKVTVDDASQQRIISKKKLRVADFGDSSPILEMALAAGGELISSHPAVVAAGPVIVLWGKIDAQYEKTLTRLLKWSDIDVSQLGQNPEMIRIAESPEPLIGCTFEVVWTNGLGITKLKQTDGPVKVKLDEIKNWAQTADPLFDYYIMDTVNRPVGATWKVDGNEAVNILSSQGASNSAGSLSLKYLRDGEFGDRPCRCLAIQDGKMGFLLERDDHNTEVAASGIQGQIFYDVEVYLALEANGKCHIYDKVKSTSHLLFQAEWQRDVDVDFRYEAKVIANGGK